MHGVSWAQHKIWPRSWTQSPYQRALCSVARLTKMLNEPQTLRAHTWGTMERRSRREAELVEAQLRVALHQRRLRKKVAQELEPPPEPDRIKRPNRIAVHPARPPELDHLTDEAASAALASHYGNFTLAARELGVDAKLLRRLFWHNPRIMDTSKERTELFHSMVIDELVVQLNSRSYGKYLRAAAELVDYPTIRPVPGLGKLLTRDIKPGKPRGRHARKPAPVNVDAVVEREVERRVERERERITGGTGSASARVLERAPARVPGLISDSRGRELEARKHAELNAGSAVVARSGRPGAKGADRDHLPTGRRWRSVRLTVGERTPKGACDRLADSLQSSRLRPAP